MFIGFGLLSSSNRLGPEEIPKGKIGFCAIGSRSVKPVAITVIWISPFFSLSFSTAPKITLALGSMFSVIILAASLISAILKSEPPETLNSTPRAPSIATSNKGELIAILAASTARSSPVL